MISSWRFIAFAVVFGLSGPILSTHAFRSGLQSHKKSLKSHLEVKVTMKTRAHLRYQLELARMRREHEESMANFTQHTTLEKACKILKQDPQAKPALISFVERNLKTHTASLTGAVFRGTQNRRYSPSGGVAKARDMLNTMLSNASMNLDSQHHQCSMFFNQQCSMMESTREDISSANSEAADYRGEVLLAQKEINVCEVNIPRIKFELEEAMAECLKRKTFLERDLKVVMEDIEVMEAVLALTQCGPGGFLQTDQVQLLKCREECGAFVAVNHSTLAAKLRKLQSPAVRNNVQNSLREMLVQDKVAQPTEFKNAPLPQQAIPDDPCNGISYDTGKGKGGCSLRTNPNCLNLQNKFLIIMSDTVDKRDELLDELEKLRISCAKTKHTLEAEIEAFEIKLGSENAKLAEATAGENSAAEEAKMKGLQHEEMQHAMFETRESCSSKLRQFESEICALKKIRGELFKLKGDTHPFFMDCEVGEWEPEECSATCGGGTQILRRQVITAPSGGGMVCPPLLMKQSCNEDPCPVDCVLEEWSGWSGCSADCGGGVMEKTRMIKVHPKYDGTPCGEITETTACNMQACDQDCELHDWTEWGKCSKACGMGFKLRRKFVETPAVGLGKCPDSRSRARFEFAKCTKGPCEPPEPKPVVCKSTVDISLILDASGTVGPEGWAKTQKFANLFSTSFEGDGTDAQLSFIAFSGPTVMADLDSCTGKGVEVDMEGVCKVKMVAPFGTALGAARTNLNGVSFMAGTRLLSGAMEMSRAEFTLARKNSTKIVLIVTGARPTKLAATWMAARSLNRVADKVMFAAVNSNDQALQEYRSWGSRPAAENILNLGTFDNLDTVDTVNNLVTSICDEVSEA